MKPLTHEEAISRARSIHVDSYRVDLDLTQPETFAVTTRIRFTCAEPGAGTFVEHDQVRITSASINGRPFEAGEVADGRIQLVDLEADNELEVTSVGRFSVSAEGLCRFVDPQDDEVYVFSHCFLDLAPRVFACFDQPDLKAPFEIHASVPPGWTVRSNGVGHEVEPGRWAFETTPPLPTYIVGIMAGRWHVAEAQHEEIPMALLCRRSMAPFLDAEALFRDTADAMAAYIDLFGPYPFEKFDQVFCPNWLGGMENAALVTLGEDNLFRSHVTDADRYARSDLIYHELAHMWFGNCVTTRWWDDLWLNEAFATYVATLALSRTSRGRSAWISFAFMKEYAYRQDQMPTTHPVSAPVADTVDALSNFDGISYVKGASAIKQLAAWVGTEAFEKGLRRFIAEHVFSNAQLGDLLHALEGSSGRDLRTWADAWLRTSGVGMLSAAAVLDEDGRYGSFAIEQSASEPHPTLRPHRLDVGLFDRRGEAFVRREGVPIEVEGARAEVSALAGERAPDLTMIDDQDLSYTKIRLESDTLETLLDAGIWRVADPLSRARLWMVMRDLVEDAELPVGTYLHALIEGIERDEDASIVSSLYTHGLDAIRHLGDAAALHRRTEELAARSGAALDRALAGSDHQLAFLRGLIDTATAPSVLERVRGWLDGDGVPPGVVIGPTERWAVVCRLAVVGDAGSDVVDAEARRDASTTGAERAAIARAGIRTPAAKDAAWAAIFAGEDESYTMRMARATGFGHAEHTDLIRPFVDRMLPDLDAVWRRDSPFGAALLSQVLLSSVPVEAASMAMLDAAIASVDLSAGLRRIVLEERWVLGRALATRAVDLND